MPNFCAAYGCSNTSNKCKERDVYFHRFPMKNKDLLQSWLLKIRRENFVPTEHSRLCSEHFEDHSYEKTFMGKNVLKADSVPTIFTFCSRSKRKRTSYEFAAHASNLLPEPATKETYVQTDPDIISTLLEMNETFQRELESLKMYLMKVEFKLENIINHPGFHFISGFHKDTYEVLYNFLLLESEECLQSFDMPVHQQFFFFMVRLRTGITEHFLAILSGVNQSTISRMHQKCVQVIHQKLVAVPIWPTRSQIKEYMPEKFLSKYPDCRVIIDATEFKIPKPSSPTEQQLTFSHYKNDNTLKGIVGIAPSGAICYISNLWGGSISDKELFMRSGLLDQLEPGDLVMADRGFRIVREVEEKGCKVATPVFLKDKIQFTIEERANSCNLSHLRVDVERAISQIKVFRYFKNVHYLSLHNINEAFYIACFLTLFNKSDNILN